VKPSVADPAFMARVIALLLLAGATLGLASMLLPPPAGQGEVGVYTTIGAAYGLAAVVWFGHRRAPRVTPTLALVAGTVLISVGTYFTGQSTSPYPLFFVWIGLCAFYFLSRPAAIGVVTFAGANYAFLLWVQGASHAAERWGVTMGTAVVAGLAMSYMRTRLEGLVERPGGGAAAQRCRPHRPAHGSGQPPRLRRAA